MATKTQIIKNETVNIPEYARPYYEDLLQRGQAESYRPYIPYGYTQDPKTGEVVKAREAVLDKDGNPTYRTVTPSGAGEADYKAYLANNPDVAAAAQASGMDPIAFAQQHYRDFGKTENRALTYQPPQSRQEQIFKDVDAQRLAGFTPAQEQVQKDVMDMKRPEQFGSADRAMQSGVAALARTQDYKAANFAADQVGAERVGAERIAADQVSAERIAADQVSAERIAAERIAAERVAAERVGAERVAAERINSERVRAAALKEYQLQGPQQFGQAQAQQYISPYVQNVLDIQKQQAIADAQKGQLVQNLGAARQGTYGGARQLLATTERERALGQQLGNIQATGLQSAYENAQQQFERDRNAQLGVGTTNLNALLGVQSLGTETGLRASLANQQTGFQTAQTNQEAALRAVLANQQTGLQAGLANQQTNLQAGLANQQTGLQASQSNQEAALRASLANQQTGLQAAQSNQQYNFQAAQANQQTGLQAALSNQQHNFQAAQANQQTGLQAGLANQQTGLQASLANQQQNFQAAQANQQTGLQAGLANQQTGLQAAQSNQQYNFQAAQANQQTGLQAGLANQQTGLQASLANQQQNLEAQRLSEASRQFGSNLGLQGAQAYGQLGQTYANVGTAQQQADLQRYNAQNAIGAQQQAQQQQGIDIKRDDFLRQQNYPMEQLGFQSSLLRGLPSAVNTTQTTSAPGANQFAQAAGAGLSALSYAKLLGGP